MQTSDTTTFTRSILAATLLGALALASACGRSAEELESYARLYDERGDHVRAVVEWTNALEKAPDDADLLLGRGRSFLASNQYAAARADFDRVVELGQHGVEPRFLIAESWSQEGEFERALQALQGLEATDPVRTRRLQGGVRLERATSVLRSMLRDLASLAPDDPDTIWRGLAALDFATARAYLEDPRHSPEVRALLTPMSQANEDLLAAAEDLSVAAAATGPEAAEAVCDLAELDLLYQRFPAAMTRLHRLLDDPLQMSTEKRARGLLADTLEQRGDLEGALDQMAAAVTAHPSDLDLRFARGMLLLKLGRLDDAGPDVEAVASDPYRGVQAKLLQGILKLQGGDSHGAVADFQYLAANASGTPITHLWLGLALAATSDDSSAAMAAFSRAVEIDPRFYTAHLARAGTALKTGWADVAVQHGRRCTELDPTNAAGWLVLGEALVRRAGTQKRTRAREADFTAAAEALGHALQRDPRGFTGHEALVMRNVITGKLSEGIASLRSAMADSREPDLLATLAELLFTDHQTAEALLCLEEAVGVDPGHLRSVRSLAAVYAEQRRDADAVRVLQAARNAAGADGEASVLLATHLVDGAEIADARRVIAESVQAYPRHRGLALMRVRLAIQDEDLLDAEAACLAGLEVAPGLRPFHQAGALAALRGDDATAAERLAASLQRHPSDVALLATQALVAARSGDQATALIAARSTAERAPGDPYLLAAAGIAMQLAGDSAGARALARAAKTLATPARDLVLRQLDHAASSDGASQTLIGLHLRTLAAGPGVRAGEPPIEESRAAELLGGSGSRDGLLIDMIANAHLARGDAAGAAAHYERLLEVEPRLVGAREKLALIRAHAGDGGAALDALVQLFSAGTRSPRAHALAGALYEERGDLGDAHRHLQRSIELDGNNPEVLARLAHVLEREDLMPDARVLWERVLLLAPIHPVGNARMAEILVEEQPSRAETLARRSVALDPRSPYSRRALGRVLLVQRRPAEASRELTKAIAIAPGDAELWALSGVAAFSAGDHAAAEHALREAEQRDAAQPLARLHLGMLAELRGDLAPAIAHYEAVLATDEEHATALNNLASCLQRSGGDLEQAHAFAVRAVDASNGGASALDTRGWIEFALGRTSAAAGTLARAVQADPDNLSTRYHLAVALAEAGRRPEALRELEILRMVPDDFPERSESDALLQRLQNR